MRIKGIILAAIMIIAMAVPASAQFRFGPKVGITVSELHFSKSVFNEGNRTGFTGGLMTEFTVPIIGLGFDASVMYARHSEKRDYIDIPVNLKYKFGLPVIGKIITPFLTTGPSFSVLVKDLSGAKNFSTSWNFGLGVALVNHIQVAASYGFGISKAAYVEDAGSGKDRCWTITAAYLF
ncbi:MAG: porin family protein [Lachnospiraceae bacterium]|nr:porin family protein [Lachnospiraceae bacterium]